MPKKCQFCGLYYEEVKPYPIRDHPNLPPVLKTRVANLLYIYAHEECLAAWCTKVLTAIQENHQWRKK
jgi:hypothetical protein